MDQGGVPRWTGQVELGKYDVELIDLVISSVDGMTFKGQGWLHWERKSGCRIKAITDGRMKPLEHWFKTQPKPGELFSDDHYFRLRAKTREGFDVSVARLYPGGYHIVTSHELVTWDIPDPYFYAPVVISTDERHGHAKQITILLHTALKGVWSNQSVTTNDNEEFGYTQSDFDWVKYECRLGTVAAQRRRDCTAVKVWGYEDADSENVVNAIRLAFSFMTGRMVNATSLERLDNGKETRILNLPRANVRSGSLYPPLEDHPASWGHIAPMLSKLTDFFIADANRMMGNLLYTCLDAVDNPFSTKALVVAATLEGIAREVGGVTHDAEHSSTGTLDECIAAAVAFLHERGCNRAARRISGFFSKRMKSPDATNILEWWASKNVMGITQQEVQAWKAVRHGPAHGTLLMINRGQQEAQENISNLVRVNNLLNKLFLQACGYSGLYYDRSVWADGHFEAEEPTNVVFGAGGAN